MKLPPITESPVEHPVRMPGVTALKKAYREFVVDLALCGDLSSFEALLSVSQPLIARVQAELPDWWDGKFWNGVEYETEPNRGLAELIEEKRKELTR